ncbi:MAG: Spy/CpxP family protein refolding chaperone [Burkholderiales bacterium]
MALGIAAAAFAHGGGGPRAGDGACPAGHEEHCGATQGGGRSGHGMSGHGMRGQGMGGHGDGGHGMRGGLSLDAAKAELKLTPEQQPAFEKYAALVNTQAEARKRMHEGMHSGSADHRAMHDTMQAYNRQAAIELTAVRKELYDVLTPEQRAIAERNLGNSSMAMGGGRGHRH